MPKHGACNLSSINLSEYVKDPFTENASIDYEQLRKDIPIYVQAMDQIVTENSKLHALEEQRQFSLDHRNIGIGIMGLADAFIKIGVTYGDEKSIKLAQEVISFIFKECVKASNILAKDLGTFPKYLPEVFESDIINNHFSRDEIAQFKKYGLRNASLLSIAPTGSIATMLGVSTGIEPYFSSKYTRKTVSLSGEGDKYYTVDVPIFNTSKIICWHPESLVTSSDILWKNRIEIQSALQYSVDTAISSTVNLKESVTENEIAQLYLYAWKKGLKGITIFRSGSRTGVLTTGDPVPKKETVKETKFNYIKPVSRKTLGTTSGTTSCKKCACGTLYITCNRDSKGNLVEVFTHTSKGGICQANMNALTRLISLGLRSGVEVDEIIDQIQGINCPACTTCKARGVDISGLSCPDIISRTIKEAIKVTPIAIKSTPNIDHSLQTVTQEPTQKCPECGEPLISTGGCISCPSCGWSRCS